MIIALPLSFSWQPVATASQGAMQPATPASITGTVAYLAKGSAESHLIEIDGSNDRNIWSVPDPQYNRVSNLAWRPDASEIAFASNHEQTVLGFESDLYAIKPDGRGLRKLTNVPSATALSGFPKGNVTLTIGNGSIDAGPFLIYIYGAAVAQSVNIPPGTVKVVTFDDVSDYGNVGQAVVAIDGVFRWVMQAVIAVAADPTLSSFSLKWSGGSRLTECFLELHGGAAMQLEFICDLELVYREEPLYHDKFLLVRPYGGQEGTGYGEGDGTVTGPRLQGSLRWVNHPHRRGDGSMLPDTHGVSVAHDKALSMFTLQGRTVFEQGQGKQLLSVIFEAEAEPYRWPNRTFCVLEGLIERERLRMRARVYACRSDLV